MAQPQDLEQTITSVSGRPGPVLSAYLSVNADIPENQGRAYLVRLRDAVNDEGVPEGCSGGSGSIPRSTRRPGRSPSSRTRMGASQGHSPTATRPSCTDSISNL